MGYICGGMIILAMGVFTFLKPDLIWKITEGWKFYNADGPSEFYLKITKIAGILYVLFGIAMMVVPFISELKASIN